MTENITKADDCQRKTVLFISSDKLGKGNDELGKTLIRNFIHTLSGQENPPETIIFINAGVKLIAAGSPVIEELTVLQNNGVKILACGTCLDYFDLKEKIMVGQISNMHDITAILMARSHLVSL
ncbi:MAG: sulfurtransferase-like selenium metabolism protein YedF [Bacillota bacterium]|nr:sulfurtransferase-like selenium metabolism protein YedF [Bacillota bacterium]